MIDTLLSSALNDSEISHEEFTNIILKQIFMKILKKILRTLP